MALTQTRLVKVSIFSEQKTNLSPSVRTCRAIKYGSKLVHFIRMRVPIYMIFSSPEPKAHSELIVYQSSRCPSVRAAVRACVHINISETSGPIATKFYLKHHWGGGKAALGFWPDRIGTLVSMATDSSHRVIVGKISLAP